MKINFNKKIIFWLLFLLVILLGLFWNKLGNLEQIKFLASKLNFSKAGIIMNLPEPSDKNNSEEVDLSDINFKNLPLTEIPLVKGDNNKEGNIASTSKPKELKSESFKKQMTLAEIQNEVNIVKEKTKEIEKKVNILKTLTEIQKNVDKIAQEMESIGREIEKINGQV